MESNDEHVIRVWGELGMTTRNYAAVDLGAESGRTILARFDGERFTLEPTHRFPNGYVRILGTMYWDIVRLWQEIKNGLGGTFRLAGSLDGIGVDTWGVDFGFVADDGSLVGNPVHYRDRRTEGIYDAAFALMPKEEIYRRTGLQFLPFNTLFQLLAQRRTRGERAFVGVDKMLFIPDLLNSFLTGRRVAEYTIASTSQMLDARTQTWDLELLQKFGIPASILPDLVATGTKLGPLRADVAREIGGSALVVATAGHDTASAVAAVPAEGKGWAYISSGTWSLMGVERREPALTAESLANNFTHEGGVGGTIRFLKNIMGLWLVQECRRSFERAGSTLGYAELTEAAGAERPFACLLNPDDLTFMNPPDMPSAIADFCKRTGQSAPAEPGGYVRACLEALALRYRATKEELESTLGEKITRIHIVGGGSQNRLLSQLTADCTGAQIVAGPIEATALGNVVVQAIATGDLASLEEGREAVRRSFPTESFEPRESERAAWEEHYGRFKQMVSAP